MRCATSLEASFESKAFFALRSFLLGVPAAGGAGGGRGSLWTWCPLIAGASSWAWPIGTFARGASGAVDVIVQRSEGPEFWGALGATAMSGLSCVVPVQCLVCHWQAVSADGVASQCSSV